MHLHAAYAQVALIIFQLARVTCPRNDNNFFVMIKPPLSHKLVLLQYKTLVGRVIPLACALFHFVGAITARSQSSFFFNIHTLAFRLSQTSEINVINFVAIIPNEYKVGTTIARLNP